MATTPTKAKGAGTPRKRGPNKKKAGSGVSGGEDDDEEHSPLKKVKSGRVAKARGKSGYSLKQSESDVEDEDMVGDM